MTPKLNIFINRGVAQLVAREVWDFDAVGSNPATPTKIAVLTAKSKPQKNSLRLILYRGFLMIYISIMLLVAILVASRFPIVKGIIGETIIRIVIGRNTVNQKQQKYVINNLVLEITPGKTSQVDHVVINPNGVFVIETKNYSGRIYGNESQLNWTQVLNYGKVKNHFYSPIKQNQTHVYAIQEIIKQDVPIDTLVVFVKGNIQYIQSPNVYTVWGLLQKLKEPSVKTISREQMELIYDTLLKHNRRNTISNAEHINNIEMMKNNITNNICPRCGSPLVLRHGKYGNFMGCSRYPQCRFIKK